MKIAALRLVALSLAMTLGLSGVARGQVPAPDFDVYASLVGPNFMVVNMEVQGPPNTPVGIFYTLDNPYTTPPGLINVSTFVSVQTDATGHFLMNVPLNGQGPLPDVWMAAVLFPAGGSPIVPNITGLSGAFFAPSWAAPWLAGTKSSDHSFRVAGETVPNRTISIWKTDGPCPSVGDTFSSAGSGTHYEGGTVSDGNGDYGWAGTIDPPGCIVVCETFSDGTLVVIARKQAE